MWDAIVEFFTGSSSGATAEMIEAGTTGFAGAGMEAAVLGADAYSFSDWFGSLFEAENVGTAQSVLEAGGDTGSAVGGVSKVAVDAPDTKTIAQRVLTAEPTIEEGTLTKLPAEKGVFGRMVQWVKDLDSDEQKMFFKALEVGGGIAGGVGIAALKGKNQEDSIRLQAELAGQKAYDEQSGVTRAKQDLNKVPAGVPFKPKKGALLSNQMGQPVYNPNNPLVPRPGLIYGGMR